MLGFLTGIFGLIAAAGMPALPKLEQTQEVPKHDPSVDAAIIVTFLLLFGAAALAWLAR